MISDILEKGTNEEGEILEENPRTWILLAENKEAEKEKWDSPGAERGSGNGTSPLSGIQAGPWGFLVTPPVWVSASVPLRGRDAGPSKVLLQPDLRSYNHCDAPQGGLQHGHRCLRPVLHLEGISTWNAILLGNKNKAGWKGVGTSHWDVTGMGYCISYVGPGLVCGKEPQPIICKWIFKTPVQAK